jgi:ATP-dependent Clp protease ATP-binding subunit ClpC
MFERYSEKARRVIFFARYEASQWSAEVIEPAHLLLGLLREDRTLFRKFLRAQEPLRNVAGSLGLKPSERNIFVSGDMPLSEAAKRVLTYAAEEAEQKGHRFVSTQHLLLGLLREPGPVQYLLEAEGLRLSAVREAALPEVMPPAGQLPTRELWELASAVGPSNQQIVADLRAQFRPLTNRLTAEVEPAVAYRLEQSR